MVEIKYPYSKNSTGLESIRLEDLVEEVKIEKNNESPNDFVRSGRVELD